MKKIIFLAAVILNQSLTGLISSATLFEKSNGTKKQLIAICGDRHRFGYWNDNAIQFLNFAHLAAQKNLNTLFLIENLSSTNALFDRAQDRLIIQTRQNCILNNIISHFDQQSPTEMTSILLYFGASKDFYTKLGTFIQLPQTSINLLQTLPVINVDNRHRTVYYGESLIGWNYEPYTIPAVRTIQQQESKSLSLFDLFTPQATLKEYVTKSTGSLRDIFEEIRIRQERHKNNLLQELGENFNINELMATTKPLATLLEKRQQELYRFLPQSSLQYIFDEMVEANALWHITQSNADVIIVLAGTDHTGHTEGYFVNQRPGLTKFLRRLGYQQVDNMYTSNYDVKYNQTASALHVRDAIPAMIAKRIKG